MNNIDALNFFKVLIADNKSMNEHARDAIVCAIDALRTAVEVENRPADARKETRRTSVPGEPFRAEIGEIRDAITELQIRVGLLEMKALRISLPLSVRIGMFWRFGFEELSLPVAVSA